MYKKFTALFLTVLLFFIALLASCAENSEAISKDTSTSADSTQPAAEEESYSFPSIDLSGGDLTLLNTTTTWNFYTYLDHESMTGEVLDDAVYNRNRLIEEKFNLKLNVIEEKIDNIYNKIIVSVQSGEQLCDAVFCPGWISDSSNIGSLAIEHMFYDLSELPEINLESEWWSQALRTEGVIGKNGALYFAASDINISTLQSTWCLFFNETLFENMNLDRPYSLVKDGKWTFDKFAELVKAGAQLNGEDNFTWTADGGSIYGYTSYSGGTLALLLGSGERFIGKDSDGNPVLALETQRFYDVCTKVASLLGVAGYYVNANDASQNGFHFEDIFMKGRALFTGAELKAATRFRTMEDAYGVVPMPKYDEAQPDYYSVKTRQAYLLVIPSTNPEPNRTGAILDALAYVSYKDVTPVLYDVTISQKGLRNEESVEMLKLIRNTQYYDAGIIYGWTSALNNAIITAVDAGNSDIASTIEKNKNKVITDIQKTMDVFYG
jgi:hypothetical protein